MNRAPLMFADRAAKVPAPFAVSGGSVSLEVVKKAEKSDDLVVRLVEITGSAAKCELRTALSGVKLVETNLIEWEELGTSEFRDGAAELSFKPFEIRTFKIRKA
ncbi:hypothetical protein SDC9_127823 [bioreactor metagenome]|uniref:Glycosyl hydrolases family 38 C-terminal domain-containing protein n=1 Tax=bioreactor metagenome TaxID=1076179 RepID=A0A645CV57_9ZZZZ